MKFLSRKFKNDGYYGISVILASITVALYLVANILKRIDITLYATLLENILFFPPYILRAHKLWTFLTYQFYSRDLLSVIFDAFFLIWCGTALERTVGSKEFLLYYVLCNLTVALAYFALGFIPHSLFQSLRLSYLSSDCGALDAALLFMFSYYARNIKMLLFFVLPISAPLILVVIFAIRLLSFIGSGAPAFGGFLCYTIGLVYAGLYMAIRMKKDIKGFLKSVISTR